MLVEHAGPWGRQGLLDARLPRGVGSGLRRLETTSGARILLIRRPDRRIHGTVSCFSIDAHPGDPWIGRTELSRIDDALALDPADRAMFTGSSGPLVVVCTHGRRDPCCAERGRPLALATAEVFPEATWESTHVGGDRFAGNLVVFPHGLFFGHVGAPDGAEIMRGFLRGSIALEWFRGRSSFAMPVQAAEAALRTELDLDGIDDVVLLGSASHGGRTTCVFRSTSERTFEVVVDRTPGAPMRLTCHARADETPNRWSVRSVKRLA